MDDIKRLVNLGVEAKRNGKYEQAMSYYQQALEYNEDNPEVRNAIAKILFITKDYEKALAEFFMAAALSANFIDHNMLSNERNTDVSFYVKKTAVESQCKSLLLNFGRHCGFSLAAVSHDDQSKRTPIQAAINKYRSQIDPYGKPEFMDVEKGVLDMTEEKITDIGLDYLLGMSLDMDVYPLKVITSKFLQN